LKYRDCSLLPGLRFRVKVIELRVVLIEEGGSGDAFLDSSMLKELVMRGVEERRIGHFSVFSSELYR
jgi:hypothetical protein